MAFGVVQAAVRTTTVMSVAVVVIRNRDIPRPRHNQVEEVEEVEEIEEVEEADDTATALPEEVAETEEGDAEELELFEAELNGVSYFITDETNGDIYENIDGDIGDIIGHIKNGIPTFTKNAA